MQKNPVIAARGMGAGHKALTFALVLVGVCFAGMTEAWAVASGLQAAINEVYNQGTAIVQPLGIIAIIALGIGAMNGKITWTQALVVAIGISIASSPGTYANMIR